MRYPERATVCVSSQAGCAMGCTFCATGQAGFERHLDAGEIVEQVAARRGTRRPNACQQRRVHGHGRAARQLRRDVGRGRAPPRRPRALGPAPHRSAPSASSPASAASPHEDLPVTLAVSLHAATDDELRDELVPLNRRYPLAEVLDAARRVRRRQGPAGDLRVGLHRRRERLAGAGRRARPAARRVPGVGGAHVNLIPLNPTAGFGGHAPAAPSAAGLRRPAAGRRGQRHRAPQPRHRHRRGLRPAAGRSRHGDADGGESPPVGNNGAVNDGSGSTSSSRRPSTSATILCYIDAVFGLHLRFVATSILAGLIAIGARGRRVRHRQREEWGYTLAVGGAVLQVVMLLAVLRQPTCSTSPLIINLMFDGALVALLLHPMSRDYQRIWFK